MIICWYDMMIDGNIIDPCENDKITKVTQEVKNIGIICYYYY